MNYNDPFAVQQSSPINRTLRLIELQGDVTLNWPEGYSGANYIAAINEVDTYAAGFAISLPDAQAANEGTAILFANRGAHTFTIKDFDGNVLTSLDAGNVKYLYCVDNSEHAGVWRVTTFGSTTHTADAAALAGPGVAAIGGRLTAAYPVTLTSSSQTVTASDRAKLFVANLGSVTLTLPPYTVGSEFFISAKNSGSGSMTVSAPSGTIDGLPNLVLAPNESAVIVCSGTPSWYTVGLGRSTEFQFTKLVKDITAGGTFTLTSAEASNKLMQFIGNPGTNVIIVAPSVVGIYYVQNSFTGPNTLTMKTASGNGIALSSSDRAILYCDGVNIVAAQTAAVGTNVSVLDGSLVSPAINFSADPNTGLYRADVDTVGIASNGVEAARFHSTKSSISGRLGIGTTNPLSPLHVIAPASSQSVLLQGTNSYIGFWHTNGDVRAGYLQFFDTGTTMEYRANVDYSSGLHCFLIGGVKKAHINNVGLSVFGHIGSSGNLSLDGNIAALGSANISGNAAITGSTTINGNLAVGGSITNLSGQSIFASLAGLAGNTYSGAQNATVFRTRFINHGAVSTTASFDMTLAGTQAIVIAGNITIGFFNPPPANYDQLMYLRIINGATYTVNWASNVRHPKGIKPVLSTGSDLLAVWYDPVSGNFVVGKVWEDFK